jgi:hypothetical protein
MQKIKQWVSEEGGVWTLEKVKVKKGIEVSPQGIWCRLRRRSGVGKQEDLLTQRLKRGQKKLSKKGGLKRRSRRGGE